jgi:type II secretory pathway component GspD/PulD (secretin)
MVTYKGRLRQKSKKVPITEALKYLFRGSQFTFWETNGIYFIGPHEMQTANNSTLIRLKHMKAEEALNMLPASLTKSTQIKVIKSQNALMAVGSYDDIDAVSQYIEKMDMPIAQILIEALVVDVDLVKARTYGIDLFLGDVPATGGSEPLYPNIDQVLNKSQSQRVLNKIGIGDVVNLPKGFFMKVQALEQEKILDVKSRSQIATLNGETAVLTIGQTQYFLLTSETDFNQGDALTNRTTERFEKVEANVTLTVTPYVTGQK